MCVYQFRHLGCGQARASFYRMKRVCQWDAQDGAQNHTSANRSRQKKTPPEVGFFNHLAPKRGLEPPRLAAHGPEPCASTNSATWARVRCAAKNAIIAGRFTLSSILGPN